MGYKWCVVPLCTNTSIRSPHKLFVSVPTNRKRRKKWLQLSRRDPASILSHTNVFMCEDHFDIEKAIINYMQYKMGFSQKIRLTDEAVPTKFHCQEDHKRRLSDSKSSRKVILKRKRLNLNTECVQTQNATDSNSERLQKDGRNMIQEIIDHRGSGFFRADPGHLQDHTYSYDSRLASSPLATGKPIDGPNETGLLKGNGTGIENDGKYTPGPSKPPDQGALSSGIKCRLQEIDNINTDHDIKIDDVLDSPEHHSYDDVTIEDVPPEPAKEFSWQKPEATVDLVLDADDESPPDYLADDLSLYCSDEDDRKSLLGDVKGLGGFQCNSCTKDIEGYACVQCADFDLCAACEASGAHDDHYVLRVPGTRPHEEVQRVLARIRSYLLMVESDPIRNDVDNISIKSEIKEEDAEESPQEALQGQEEVLEEDVLSQGLDRSHDETSQDEEDPLRPDDKSDTDTISHVDDASDYEWMPPREDPEGSESDQELDTRTVPRNTSIKPQTETEQTDLQIERTDVPTNSSTQPLQVVKQATELRPVIQRLTPNALPTATPRIVLDKYTMDQLRELQIKTTQKGTKKRKLFISRSDLDKLLKLQPAVKQVRRNEQPAPSSLFVGTTRTAAESINR